MDGKETKTMLKLTASSKSCPLDLSANSNSCVVESGKLTRKHTILLQTRLQEVIRAKIVILDQITQLLRRVI